MLNGLFRLSAAAAASRLGLLLLLTLPYIIIRSERARSLDAACPLSLPPDTPSMQPPPPPLSNDEPEDARPRPLNADRPEPARCRSRMLRERGDKLRCLFRSGRFSSIASPARCAFRIASSRLIWRFRGGGGVKHLSSSSSFSCLAFSGPLALMPLPDLLCRPTA